MVLQLDRSLGKHRVGKAKERRKEPLGKESWSQTALGEKVSRRGCAILLFFALVLLVEAFLSDSSPRPLYALATGLI